MSGLDVSLIPVKVVGQRKGLGLQQIDLCGLVFVKKPDVFFAGYGNGILDKNDQKRILTLIFNIRNPGARFEFPFFNKRKFLFLAVKIVVGINQAILNHLLIKLIS